MKFTQERRYFDYSAIMVEAVRAIRRDKRLHYRSIETNVCCQPRIAQRLPIGAVSIYHEVENRPGCLGFKRVKEVMHLP